MLAKVESSENRAEAESEKAKRTLRKGSPRWEELRIKVRDIVSRINRDEHEDSAVRCLCQMLSEWNLSLAELRPLLGEFEIEESRVSELKIVLENRIQARAFLAGKSFKICLFNARLERENALRRILVRLIRSLTRHPIDSRDFAGGDWRVRQDERGQLQFIHRDGDKLELLDLMPPCGGRQ